MEDSKTANCDTLIHCHDCPETLSYDMESRLSGVRKLMVMWL